MASILPWLRVRLPAAVWQPITKGGTVALVSRLTRAEGEKQRMRFEGFNPSLAEHHLRKV